MASPDNRAYAKDAMRFAYADPPYLGCCAKYGHRHEDWGCWDLERTHRKLLRYLHEVYDGTPSTTCSPAPESWAGC